MSIINVPDFNISSFSIGTPNVVENGYESFVKYNGNEILIQTPLCKIDKIDNTLSIMFKLSDNFQYFQFFCSLYELIIKNLCRYCESDKYKILSNLNSDHEEIRKKFNSYVVKVNDTDMFVYLKINPNTKFFEKTKKEISSSELKRGDNVVCIIKANQIFMNEESAIHTWDCIQCLRWKKSKTNLNSETKSIQEVKINQDGNSND